MPPFRRSYPTQVDGSLSQPASLFPNLSKSGISSKPIRVSSSPSCVTIFPVALHSDEFEVSQGALAARNNWLSLMPSNDIRPHSAGPYGNFFALCWPYGDTERVKLATEIIETLWLYDGKLKHSLTFAYYANASPIRSHRGCPS
jgi:hypothetical protein